MIEVKITKEQFDRINRYHYNQEKKYAYISKEITDGRYEVTPETTFVTYNDPWHYYLVFEGTAIPSEKIKPSSIVDELTKKLKET